MASCAIPGWYAPVLIGGRRYVDGGACRRPAPTCSPREGLDEVYVLAPMASFVSDHPRPVAARLERRLRRQVTRRLIHEAQKVSRGGAAVTVLAPGPEDLAEIGANLMDPAPPARGARDLAAHQPGGAAPSRSPTTSGWSL